MAKKITGYVKLQVPAGQASPSPPIGPALGQAGLNIMDFCKAFNAQTEKLEKGMPCPVVITVFQDKSFEFIVKKPPASYYIKKEVSIKAQRKASMKIQKGGNTHTLVEERLFQNLNIILNSM